MKPKPFAEHTRVVLTRPLPSLGLQPGDVGVIVHIYGKEKWEVAYGVEFFTPDRISLGVETVLAGDLRQESEQ